MSALMKSVTAGLTLLLMSLSVPDAIAGNRRPLDCPLRDARFSIDGPLVDLLLSDPAKRLIDAYSPGLMAAMPTTDAPTFSAIITLRGVLTAIKPQDAGALARLEAQLNALPVNRADKAARCKRYDDERPALAPGRGKLRVLLFEKMTGFRDTPSVEAARAAFQAMARRNGWALAVTDRGGAMHAATLARFDLVIWNNVSGDVLTRSQRAAFRRYVEGGGGYVGVHGSAGDPVYFWDWYADTLIGARFIGHPSDPQFQSARVAIEPAGSGIGRGLAPGWTMTDEWYSFARSPRLTGAQVVATLDENTYKPGINRLGGGSLAMGSDHPIAWTRCVGKGRSFYSAIGHRPETYVDPNHLKLLEQAIVWAGTPGHAPCTTPAASAKAK